MKNESSLEVVEMINNFNLKTFLEGRKLGDSIGGYLLITDNQCVMGYNGKRGRDAHVQAFASAISLINDLGELDFHKMMQLDIDSDKEYIKARLVNLGDRSYIAFNFGLLENITPNQLELFELFKNQYNDIIKFYSHYYGMPMINVIIPGYLTFESNDLEEIYNYLKTIVNYQKELPQDKNIIGKIVLHSKTK